MLLWLLNHYGDFLNDVLARTTGDSRVFLTARTAGASVTAFASTLLFGPIAIRWLKKRFRERIASDSPTLNKLHAGKQNTPTMGGIFVMGAVVASALLWANLTSPYVLAALGVVAALTGIGCRDDWVKQRTERNGLGVRQKLALQVLVCGITGIIVHGPLSAQSGPEGIGIIWPVGNGVIPLGLLFVPWVTFVLVGSSNALNLTDGLDGLATGCTIPAAGAFALLTYLSGNVIQSEYLDIPHVSGCGEMTVLMGALMGAMLGFLWFNSHPAEVFMGDAGSLPIGGLLGMAAIICRQEVLLVVIGGVFVVETLSVILQVSCYRLTGKRVIRCSPLHNHFVFRGDSETKIVVRFWIAAVVLAIVGLASLKLR